jgi:hypothetical protein
MTDRMDAQRTIDDLFETPNVVSIASSVDRTLAAAKKGERDPTLLDQEDIRLVCSTLLFQYAQMGIS